ncbi:TPA: SprT family protein [Staphylococcus aureus]|nr:SprT family protein [Staphylococcus aureus]
MNNDKLQRMVENLSEEKFGRTFRHCAYFNKRLRTTGGRYLLKSHDIEINPIGAPRFCNSIESYQQRANYEYYCTKCHAKYIRIRKVDTNRMRCGHCNGKLRMKRQLK